jgi:hypothetical protein
MNFEDYTYILTNITPEEFNKRFIEKEDHSISHKLINITDIQVILNLMVNEQYKYCYNIQEDRFYDIEDLKEILEEQ